MLVIHVRYVRYYKRNCCSCFELLTSLECIIGSMIKRALMKARGVDTPDPTSVATVKVERTQQDDTDNESAYAENMATGRRLGYKLSGASSTTMPSKAAEALKKARLSQAGGAD